MQNNRIKFEHGKASDFIRQTTKYPIFNLLSGEATHSKDLLHSDG